MFDSPADAIIVCGMGQGNGSLGVCWSLKTRQQGLCQWKPYHGSTHRSTLQKEVDKQHHYGNDVIANLACSHMLQKSGSRHHCTAEKPAHQPRLLASLLQRILQNIYIAITPRLKSSTNKSHIPLLGRISQRQHIHPTTTCTSQSKPPFPSRHSVNQCTSWPWIVEACKAGFGMTRTSFLLFFVGTCYGRHLLSAAKPT